MSQSADALLKAVAERIVAAYLERSGHGPVRVLSEKAAAYRAAGVDITYQTSGRLRNAKVKPDSYFGLDRAKAFDRNLPFYRSDAGHYAFKSISNTKTREPGWVLSSEADDLLYYWLAIAQPAEEVRALLAGPDEVFFSELLVERDDLRILPVRPVRTWFEGHYDAYTPRPVTVGDHIAWFRLIPRGDIDRAIPGINAVGSIFSGLYP